MHRARERFARSGRRKKRLTGPGGAFERTLFRIAEKIGGFTVEQLRDTMSGEEQMLWIAHMTLSNEEEQAAIDKAKSGKGDGEKSTRRRRR